jgi:hypothetical protein
MLFVAAGGGGDAISAAMLGPCLGVREPPILTYSWDRLIIDPVPGPRAVADFVGLVEMAPGVHEVLQSSALRPPAGSALPRLAGELPARLLLLDPSGGAAGMARQIRSAADQLDTRHLGLVDVGGDVLTRGSEPGVRSPLADLLALAACTATGLPCRLFVLAPGVDGELDEVTVLNRLGELDATQISSLGPEHVAAFRRLFTWHPSEASGLLVAAATGARGWAETRDAATSVHLTDSTPAVFAVDAYRAAERSPAARLTRTTSLAEASRLTVELTGVDEIAYEADKAARTRDLPNRQPRSTDLAAVDSQVAEAAARGADYVTVRRLAELVGATSRDELVAFQRLLADDRADRYIPPLYRTTAG